MDNLHQLLSGHLLALVEGPRLGIMTPLTRMSAPRTIDGCPETRPIHHRVFYDIQHSDHHLVLLVVLVILVFSKEVLRSVVDMGHAVVQLSQLTRVPTVGGTYQIACDALQTVDIR